MKCRHCGGNVRRKGIRHGKQRIRCNVCYKWDTIARYDGATKILLFDIETTPMEVFVWGLFGNKYISHNNVIKDWNILSWSAKWLCDSEVMGDIQTPKEAKNRDDKRIVDGIWKLIDKADIIIAHNGNKFDIKKLNTRFYLNGHVPPSPFQSIDTLLESKRNFAFSSNKLDYLSHIMRNKQKLHTDFDLWKSCLQGSKIALAKMMDYNKRDVSLLEEVYLEMRPWIKSHPNMGVYAEKDKGICPTCGSEKLEVGDSYYTTTVNKYRACRCLDCGALSRMMAGDLDLDTRRQLIRPIAR